MVIHTLRRAFAVAQTTRDGQHLTRPLLFLWTTLSLATITSHPTLALGIEPTGQPTDQDSQQRVAAFSIREIDLDDAASDESEGDKQSKQKFLVESNQSDVFDLKKIVVFGDSPVTITRRLQIEKENDAPLRVLALQSSCGCFSASIDDKDFSQSRVATLEFKIRANPSTALHQKELSVKVFFENGFELDCRALLTMYPSIRVIKNPNSPVDATLAINDAGTLVVEPDQAGNYEVEVGLACVQEDSQSLDADKLVSKRTLPDKVRVRFKPLDDAQPIHAGKETAEEYFERRFLATISGNLSDHETQSIQFDVALAGGEPRPFFVTIQRREILRVNRSGLLLSPADSEATFSIQRTDGVPLAIAAVEYDDKYLKVERLDAHDPTVHRFRVVVHQLPNKPLWRNTLRIIANDGQSKEIKIIVLNPQSSSLEKE